MNDSEKSLSRGAPEPLMNREQFVELVRGLADDLAADEGYDELAERVWAALRVARAAPAVSRGPAPEGPWRVVESNLITGGKLWWVENSVSEPYSGAYAFKLEADATAVRDALNRVAASPDEEEK